MTLLASMLRIAAVPAVIGVGMAIAAAAAPGDGELRRVALDAQALDVEGMQTGAQATRPTSEVVIGGVVQGTIDPAYEAGAGGVDYSAVTGPVRSGHVPERR